MKYDNWIRKVGEHSERSRANAERNQEYAENQRQLDDASGIVSRLSETEIEQKTEHIQSSFDCELESIRDEQRQIEAERAELRDGITKDMDILDQTIRKLEKLQEDSKYGKQFLRTQLRCSRISMQLLRLLTELNYNESGLTNDGVAQLGRTYALVHTKVSMLCEAGMHIEAATEKENAKVLSMPLEEKRRRGENYVNKIVDIYRDNLVDQGAVAGAAMDKVMAELKLHYLAELEKELAGESSQLYSDPDYEQLMVRMDSEMHPKHPDYDHASAINSFERKKLSPDQDNVFLRGESEISQSLLNMFPARRAEMVDASYMNASPAVVRLINKCIGNLKGITRIKPMPNGEWQSCHYNPSTQTIAMDERKNRDNEYEMTQHEYADVLKHEIGHFIDHMLGSVSSKQEFWEAMRKDAQKFFESKGAGSMHVNDMLDDLFSSGAGYDRNVTDILSAVLSFNKDLHKYVMERFAKEGIAFFGHDIDEYWDRKDIYGRSLNLRGKEVFANCFAIETDGYQISMNFIEQWFPNISEQMKSIINGGN